MIVRDTKIDDPKRKQRKLRAFDQLIDYMKTAISTGPSCLIRARQSASVGATSILEHCRHVGRARGHVLIGFAAKGSSWPTPGVRGQGTPNIR